MGARISMVEYVFPERKITNQDLQQEFPDYDFDSFEKKVGIKNRYVVAEQETALSLAVQACEKLLERFDRSKIDFLIYCTQSPEYFLPTTACILQEKLGLSKTTGAFDYNLGCSGFTYGVSMAKGLLASGQARNVLLVTAETYSKYLHPGDRSNRSIFGDAAAATLISYCDTDQTGKFLFGSDGSGYDKLIVKNGASRFPFAPDAPEIEYGTGNVYTDNHLYMNGPDIFTFTSDVIPAFTAEILAENNNSIEDIDHFIFHQANAFMLEFMRKKMKIAKDHFYIDLADGGNTVSCTIPVALKKYAATLQEATAKVVLVGFGVGLSWCGGPVEISGDL